jgi:uncharacterized membrane protein YhhN
MPARASAVLALGAALAVLLALVGNEWPSLWLVYLFKPLATVLIILIALYPWTRHRSAYLQWIVVGLAFSLVGDVLLIWPNQYFLAGLAAFLLTHVAYLVAFTRDCKFPANLPVWLIYLLIAAGFYWIVSPTLPAGLRIPVAVYAVLLSTMAGQSMGRFLLSRSASAQRAALGSLLFLLSDLLLAFHRFRRPLLYSSILILIPYYLGQGLIASSTSKARSTN